MNISLNWLSQYVDISGLTVDDLADRLTMAGIEVEAIEENCPIPKGVVVGEILERNSHPDADKLSVCMVNVGGEEPLQIVCGASNCDAVKKYRLLRLVLLLSNPTAVNLLSRNLNCAESTLSG